MMTLGKKLKEIKNKEIFEQNLKMKKIEEKT